MVKVIILYNKIFHYRIPVWNELAKMCDLTVTYSEGDGKVPDDMEVNFKIMHLPVRRFKSFVFQEANIRQLVKNYDAVIAYGNIAWLKYSTLPWFNNTPVIYHTIGVSASYGKKFDEHKEWDRIRAFFYSKADALAFYTDYPILKYAQLGIPKERMFVAPNTVAVHPVEGEVKKDSILMIGTLYREKGLQSLLDAYLAVKDECALPELNIVGKGPDYEPVKEWIETHQMGHFVKLRGAIYDINEKAKYFARAFAVISPKQAGLTVQESMGYGVPFVTTRNAITGGEILSIHDGQDGVLMNDVSELPAVLKDIALHPERFIAMGQAARKYYNEHLTPQLMAKGFWDAIQYAMNKKK